MRRLPALALLLAALAPLPALVLSGETGGAGNLGASLPAALLTALVAGLLAAALGGAAGLGLAARLPGRPAALAVMALPLILPPVLPGAALLLALTGLGMADSMAARLAATALWHGLLGATVVAALAWTALRRLDPALLRAAQACGAPPDLATRRLLHPRLREAVMLGGALSFALSLGESTVATLLSAGTLPTAAPLLPPLLFAAAMGLALLSRPGNGTA